VIDTTTSTWLPREGLDRLIVLLRDDGRKVVGPTLRDAAIVYDEIESSADLPNGVTDEQAPGKYRVHTSPDDKAEHSFDFASSPTSWKSYAFPASVPIAIARKDGDKVTYVDLEKDVQPMAFLGVRACDIAALNIHDTVLAGGPFVDEDYADRRGKALIVAVECAVPSGTCFCASMGTGPEVTKDYDLALTELDDGYVVRAATEAGNQLVDRLSLDVSTPLQQHEAAGVGVPGELARECVIEDWAVIIQEGKRNLETRISRAGCVGTLLYLRSALLCGLHYHAEALVPSPSPHLLCAPALRSCYPCPASVRTDGAWC
jgi:hypothetical protein